MLALVTLSLCGCSKPNKARFQAHPAHEQQQQHAGWYKGNTHAHTINSDGDSSPETVARWYKDNGYDFLFLTDHNVLTQPAETNVHNEPGFLLIPGVEVSSTYRSATDAKAKPIHVNALNAAGPISAVQGSTSVADTLQQTINNINNAQAIPHVNHPNFRWAVSHLDLMNVQGYNLLEIYNGHPSVNNAGDEERPGMEAVWDLLLTNGHQIYGVACDDAHHFTGEFTPERSNPGRAWVMVRATTLQADDILYNIVTGNFYFTTGVLIDNILVEGRSYTVYANNITGKPYTTEFIGNGGQVLYRTTRNPASYLANQSDGYVRAKVTNSTGQAAWTQPAFLLPEVTE
ncbi:MAG: PHP domain-containing protein [Sumerlaeia bacterium]